MTTGTETIGRVGAGSRDSRRPCSWKDAEFDFGDVDLCPGEVLFSSIFWATLLA